MHIYYNIYYIYSSNVLYIFFKNLWILLFLKNYFTFICNKIEKEDLVVFNVFYFSPFKYTFLLIFLWLETLIEHKVFKIFTENATKKD